MKLHSQHSIRIIAAMFLALFVVGVLGAMTLHVCCEHCHEATYCPEELESPPCCEQHTPSHADKGEGGTHHHDCDCSENEIVLLDEEVTPAVKIGNQLIPTAIALVQLCFLHHNSVCDQQYQKQTTHSPPLLACGRTILLQSAILVI